MQWLMKYDHFSPSKNLGTFQLKQLKKEIITGLLVKNLLLLEPSKGEVSSIASQMVPIILDSE